jgi:ubiquinone biosynthesis protein
VHKARLHTGEEVVVKVQRPGIAEQIRSDLSVLRYLARALEAVVEEMGIYSPSGIVEEFDRAIHEELDFLNEASNLRAFHKNHEGRDFIKIPRVYEPFTARTVLTMERVNGKKLSDIDAREHDRHALARHIIDASFQQLFEDGLFHGDPHPGNMFVLEGDRLALIDFGLVGRLSKPMQDTLIQLVLSVALRDADSTARILYRIGAPHARTQLLGFKQDLEGLFANYLPGTLGEIDARNLLRDLLDLSVKHQIRLPREYAILSRASISTEGILRSLAPDLKVSEVALPYARKLLGDRFNPGQMQGGFLRAMLRLQTVASELPTQMSQILLDLESGRFGVNVQSAQLEAMNRSLRHSALISFLGLCACGFLVGTFIALSQEPWRLWGLPLLGWVGISGFSLLFGIALTWYWFTSGPRKLSLSKFLNNRR